jgi:hypothetical protein
MIGDQRQANQARAKYDKGKLCEDLGETCRHCKTPRRGIMKGLWHALLVHFGIRNCCDNQKIVANHHSIYYYEFECENCGHVKTNTPFANL